MTHTKTLTNTRKVTIRFHLFDKRKVIFQNKNKAARAALSARERERKPQAFAKFRTIDPFGPTSVNFSQIWQHCCWRRRANKKVFKSNCFKCKQKQSNPLLSVSKATSHKTYTNTHRQTHKEIVKPGSSNFYTCIYSINSVQVEAKGLNQEVRM